MKASDIFKIGDTVKRIREYKRIKGSLIGTVVDIKDNVAVDHGGILKIITDNNKQTNWWADCCEIYTGEPELCSCDINIILSTGCQCGGK